MSDDDVDDLISEHGLREASRLMGTNGVNPTKTPADEDRSAWFARPSTQVKADALRKAMETFR